MSDRLEAYYRRLPPLIQNAALSVEGWRVARRRYGGDFDMLSSSISERSKWSHGDFLAFADARLRSSLRTATSETTFYRREPYLSAASDPEFRVGDLHQLPLIDKHIARDRAAEITSSVSDGIIWLHTSGTTGAGLRFPSTRTAASEQWATWWRYRGWHGIERSEWSAHFGGRNVAGDRTPHWRVDRGQRRLLLSAYHTNPEQLDGVIAVLNQRRPLWLHGYPSMISLVAHRLLERGVGLDYQVRWITTGAENLLQYQRVAIGEAFGVKPVEHYGSAEAVANASECTMGSIHVDEDFAAVEVVDGRLVGTSFTNPAFPLIRYETGDTARISASLCPCGLPGRVIEEIDGRLEDYLTLTDGSQLGRLDHVFKDAVRVRAAQFRQSQPGVALLIIEPGDGFSDADIAVIRQMIDDRCGNRLDLSIEVTASIPRTATGKHRLVVKG